MTKDIIKQLYDYYKYLPLFLWYRLTCRGWTPSEDIFDKHKQGFRYLYEKFCYHQILINNTLPYLKNEIELLELAVGFVGHFDASKSLSSEEMRAAENYEDISMLKKEVK